MGNDKSTRSTTLHNIVRMSPHPHLALKTYLHLANGTFFGITFFILKARNRLLLLAEMASVATFLLFWGARGPQLPFLHNRASRLSIIHCHIRRQRILRERNLTVTFLKMSLSPAYEDKSSEWEGRTVEIQDHVRFDRKRGRIETGDTPETLAKLFFPGKRSKIDTNSTDTIPGAKSGQRVVAERHGALFACGPNRIEVSTPYLFPSSCWS